MTGRPCAWCRASIDDGMRADARFCSTRCRQAAHRFRHGVGDPPGGPSPLQPLRLAYADPPYPGLSRKYYANHPDYAGEVDHAALIASLVDGFDGWALSTSAAALPDVLALCPPGVRVAAWVRGERPTRSRCPLNAWEPVVFAGGRLRVDLVGATDPSGSPAAATVARALAVASGRSSSTGDASPSDEDDATRRLDALVYRPGVRTTDPGRVIGAKPAVFARWVFDLLGALPGDDFVDVFPGSGGIALAWSLYSAGAS